MNRGIIFRNASMLVMILVFLSPLTAIAEEVENFGLEFFLISHLLKNLLKQEWEKGKVLLKVG